MAKGFKSGGRRPGSPNKVTQDLRAMIEGALDDLGGRKWLVRAAAENPAAFLTLVGKLLPRDVVVTGKLTLEQLIADSFVPVVHAQQLRDAETGLRPH